jgi:hypothetical protein
MKTVSIEIDEQLARVLCRLYKRRFRTTTKVPNGNRSFLRTFVEDRIAEEIKFLSDATT